LALKTRDMLEWLHFILRGCVGEGTQNSERPHCSIELKQIITGRGRHCRSDHLCFL